MSLDRRLARISIAVLAVAPFGAVAAFLRDQAAERPLVVLAGLIAWEIALLALAFFGKVYGKLQERWVDRVAEGIDAALRRTISRYPRQYRYFLSRMHHDVDLRGLTTWGMYSLAMDEVFVDLSLMPRVPHQVPTGPVGDQPADATRRSIWETLDRHPDAPLAILGPPGSGKTTLLRHVTLVLCRRSRHQRVPWRWRSKIPVLLFLREHVSAIIDNPGITLPDVVRQTLRRLATREPPGWLERQLDKGRCVVMLDGLDEVARREDRAVVTRWVREQVAQYPRDRFIVTSRPFGFADDPLTSATVVQVRQFTDAQVETFVRSWYLTVEQRGANRKDVGVKSRAEEGAEKLLGRLYTSPALLALATNPLLLTMIASVHKYRAALPGSRAELYREICQVFLGKRQEAKGLSSDLSVDQKSLVLQRLAFAMMERRVRDIPAPEAEGLVAPTLARVSYGGSPADFLVEMEQTSGLLIEREHKVYAFAHLTFQEYLAALHIAETQPTDYLVGKIEDPWWREVTLLRVASTDATPVVRAALDSDPLTTELLSLAADCVEQAREADLSLKERVDSALSPASWEHDPARLRLAAQVLVTRKLRHVTRGRNGVFICTEPVTNAEFRLFLQKDFGISAEGLAPAGWDSLRSDAEHEPVVGVGPLAAVRFYEWVQRELLINARLPREYELTDDDCRVVERPPATHFWTEHVYNIDLARLASLPFLVPQQDRQLSTADFLSHVSWLMYSDAAHLRAWIPSERAGDVGLRFCDPGVFEDQDTSWLDRAADLAADADVSDEVHDAEPEFLREVRRRGAGLARLLRDVAGERLSGEFTYDANPAIVPTVYQAQAPKLARWVQEAWILGRQWPELMDPYILPYRPGTDPLSRLVGARVRSHYLSILTGHPAQRRSRWRTRRPGQDPLMNIDDRRTTPEALAQHYLVELHLRGMLPRREGLLLVRE